MRVTLNGETTEIAERLPLAHLLTQMKLGERRLAVELNGSIVPRSTWPQVNLAEGDHVEIVHAIGGG
jgi:sulfur carrier protein